MVFKREYNVRVKVTGGSTQQLELFETMITGVCEAFFNKSNVDANIYLKDGTPISFRDENFSFEKYAGGEPQGRKKFK